MPGRTMPRGEETSPPGDAHPHDAAIERLVDDELPLLRAEGAEEHDPLPHFGFAVLDQLARAELGEAVAFAGLHPGDDAPVEFDADVADVAAADVMRPRMRRREMRQAAGGAEDYALVF